MRIEQKIYLRSEFIKYYDDKYGVKLGKKSILKEIINDRLFPYKVIDPKSGEMLTIGKEDIDYNKTSELSFIVVTDNVTPNPDTIMNRFKKYFGY